MDSDQRGFRGPVILETHFSEFFISDLVEIATLLIVERPLVLKILHFMFFKMAAAAILDLEVERLPTLY